MIKEHLLSGKSQKALAFLYSTTEEKAIFYAKRYFTLIDTLEEKFGPSTEEIRCFSTPGFAELGGSHTDHQHGHRLAASIHLDIIAAVRKTNTQTIELALNKSQTIYISLNPLAPSPKKESPTTALLREMVAQFIQLGYPMGGFQGVISTHLLTDAGLSSAGAWEVLIGTICNALYGHQELSALRIAQLAYQAKQNVDGISNRNQIASSLGGFVSIDFCDMEHPKVEQIPFDFSSCGYSLCLIDTGEAISNFCKQDAQILSEMETIAQHYGKKVLREVPSEIMMRQIPLLRKKYGDGAVLRSIYFYNEDTLAQQETQALKENDFRKFISLVLQAKRSSMLHLQNAESSAKPKEQGLALALAICEKILQQKGAYGVHDGGLSGTVQAFVPNDLLETFQEYMEYLFGIGHCHISTIRSVGSIELNDAFLENPKYCVPHSFVIP